MSGDNSMQTLKVLVDNACITRTLFTRNSYSPLFKKTFTYFSTYFAPASVKNTEHLSMLYWFSPYTQS